MFIIIWFIKKVVYFNYLNYIYNILIFLLLSILKSIYKITMGDINNNKNLKPNKKLLLLYFIILILVTHKHNLFDRYTSFTLFNNKIIFWIINSINILKP